VNSRRTREGAAERIFKKEGHTEWRHGPYSPQTRCGAKRFEEVLLARYLAREATGAGHGKGPGLDLDGDAEGRGAVRL